MEAKTPVSLALRPGLVRKLDKLARQVGQSRSETVSRLLGTFIDDLLSPEVAWVKIARDDLTDRILKV